MRVCLKHIGWILVFLPINWGIIHPLAGGEIHWLTGPDLEKQLAEPVDIVLVDNSLRSTLQNLGHAKKIALLIDRRVDPDQKIKLSLNALPLAECFQRIAENSGIAFARVGPVIYFAPLPVAKEVRTIVALREQDVRRLGPRATKKFVQRKSLAWHDFASPRELLQKIAATNRIKIDNLDLAPHDLWAAADLPPLELIETLTLIAGQFNLTFEVSADGNRVKLVPIPERVELLRDYPGGGDPMTIAKKYAALAPSASIKIIGDRIEVAGTLEDHERIMPTRQPIQHKRKSTDSNIELKRFTLTVKKQPIAPLLKQLARQLDLALQMDEPALEKAGVSMQQRVSFRVKEATLDELLRAALKNTPLKFIRHGNELRIEQAKKKQE
ncbi:MAG: hypothetical protein ACWGMZ_05740 [Thermoguttaceae bacterium]